MSIPIALVVNLGSDMTFSIVLSARGDLLALQPPVRNNACLGKTLFWRYQGLNKKQPCLQKLAQQNDPRG